MNILGTTLQPCNFDPITGYTRNGSCDYLYADEGTHTVCAVVTKQFLEFTKSKGNDLITPTSYFPGLKPGDKWCLCALRWLQAYKAGVAPPILAKSTNITTIRYIPQEVLMQYAI